MIRILLISLAMLLTSLDASAQQKVNDRWHRSKIKKNIDDHVRSSAQLALILFHANEIRTTVTEVYDLQRDVQDFLKEVWSTKDLLLFKGDANFTLTEEVVQSDVWLNDFGDAAGLAALIQTNGDAAVAGKELHTMLMPYDSEVDQYATLETMSAYQKERSSSRLALEKSASNRKSLMAKSYQQMADDFLAKATQLQETLTEEQDNSFYLTEAERIEALTIVDDYLQQSNDLKIKADSLIHEGKRPTPGEAGHARRLTSDLQIKGMSTLTLHNY